MEPEASAAGAPGADAESARFSGRWSSRLSRRRAQWWMAPLAAGIFVSLSTAAFAASDCRLLQVAELPVTMQGNAPLVPASINGHAVMMLLDTGAATSTIWRSSAAELKLDIHSTRARSFGAGGPDAAGLVWIDDFALAGATVHKLQLYAVGRGGWSGTAGILGEDLLSKWDLEIDLSAGKVRLFTPKHCTGDQVVYWSPTYSVLTLIPPPNDFTNDFNWLEASVRLNGREILAMFDSGASLLTVTTQALKRAGVSPETPIVAAQSTRGIAARPVDTSIAVFPSVSIGQETVQNAKLRIADLFGRDTEAHTDSLIPRDMMGGLDMLIGADFLLSHRVYVARSQRRMYFTYKGGPVFQHIPPASIQPASTAPPVAGAASGGSASAAGRDPNSGNPDSGNPNVGNPRQE